MATSANIHPEIKLRWCRSVVGCRAQEVWLVLTSVTGTRVALTWLPHLGWYEAPPTPLPCGQHTGFILIKDKVHEGGRSVQRERDYWVEPFHVVPHKFAVELFLRSDEPSPFWSHLPQLRRRYLSCGPLAGPPSPSPSPRPTRKWRSSAALTHVPHHTQPLEEDVGLTRGGSHGQLQAASASLTSLRDPDQAWASAPTLSRAFRVAVQLSRAGSRILPGLSSASSGVCLAPGDLSGPTSPESPEPATEDTSSAWSPRGPPLRLQDLCSERAAGLGEGQGHLGVDTSSYEDLLAAISAARRATFKTELNLLKFDSQTQERLVREVLAASDSDFEDEEGECEVEEAEGGHYGCVITFESRSTSMEDVGSPRALEAALVSLTSSDNGQDPARHTTPEPGPPTSPQTRPLPQSWTVTPATDSREESVEVWGAGTEGSWLEVPRRPTPPAETEREFGSSPDLAEDSNFQYDSLNHDHHHLHLDISHLDSEDSMEAPVQHRRLRQLHTRDRVETEHGDEGDKGDESEGPSSGRGYGMYEVAGREARYTSIEGEVATDIPLLPPHHPEERPSGTVHVPPLQPPPPQDTASYLPLTRATSVPTPTVSLPHHIPVSTPSLPLPMHHTTVTTPSLPLLLHDTTATTTSHSQQPSPLNTRTSTSLPLTHPTATTTPLLPSHHTDTTTTPLLTLPPPAAPSTTTTLTPLPQPRHTITLQPLPQPRHTPVTPLLPSPPATPVTEELPGSEKDSGEVNEVGPEGENEGTDGMNDVPLSNPECDDGNETPEVPPRLPESKNGREMFKEETEEGGLPWEAGGESRSEGRREKEGALCEADGEGPVETESDEATSEPYSNGISKEPESDQATKDSGSETVLNEPEGEEGVTKEPSGEGAVGEEEDEESIEEIPRAGSAEGGDNTYVTISYLIDIGSGGGIKENGDGRTRMLMADNGENGLWEESEGVEEDEEEPEVRSAGDEGDDEGNGFDDDDGFETHEDSEGVDGSREVGGEGRRQVLGGRSGSDAERTRGRVNDGSVENGVIDEGRTRVDASGERKMKIDEESEARTRQDDGESDGRKDEGNRGVGSGGMEVKDRNVQDRKEEGTEQKSDESEAQMEIVRRVKTGGRDEDVRGAREKVRGVRGREGGERTEARRGRRGVREEERGKPPQIPSTPPPPPSNAFIITTKPIPPASTITTTTTSTNHRHSPLVPQRTHSPHLTTTTTNTPSPSRHHHWTKFEVPYTPLPDRYSGPWSQKSPAAAAATRGNQTNTADYPTKPSSTLAALQRSLYAKVKGDTRPHQLGASHYSGTNFPYTHHSTSYQGSPSHRRNHHHYAHSHSSLENLKYKPSTTTAATAGHHHHLHQRSASASQYDASYTSHLQQQYLRRHSFSQYSSTTPVHRDHQYHTSPVRSRQYYQHQHKYPVLDSSLVRSSSSLALSTATNPSPLPPPAPSVSSHHHKVQGGSSTGDLRRSNLPHETSHKTTTTTTTTSNKYSSVRGASSLPNLHHNNATTTNPATSTSTTTPAPLPTNPTRAQSARDLSMGGRRRRRWGALAGTRWGASNINDDDSGGSTDSLIDEAEDAASTPLHPSLFHHPLPTTTRRQHHTSVSNLLQSSYESEVVREKRSSSSINTGRRHRRRTRSFHGGELLFPDTHTHTTTHRPPDGTVSVEGRPFLPYRGDQLGPGQQVKVLAPGGGVAVARVLASLPSPIRQRRETLDVSTALQESVTVILLSEPNRLQGSVVTVPLDKVLLAWPRP